MQELIKELLEVEEMIQSSIEHLYRKSFKKNDFKEHKALKTYKKNHLELVEKLKLYQDILNDM